MIGNLVLQWRISDSTKWLLIALISFTLVMGVYEFIVRRFNTLRILFGMKPMPTARAPQPAPAR
jgi:glucans biosynthesis protein C